MSAPCHLHSCSCNTQSVKYILSKQHSLIKNLSHRSEDGISRQLFWNSNRLEIQNKLWTTFSETEGEGFSRWSPLELLCKEAQNFWRACKLIFDQKNIWSDWKRTNMHLISYQWQELWAFHRPCCCVAWITGIWELVTAIFVSSLLSGPFPRWRVEEGVEVEDAVFHLMLEW